jgi:acetyl esterase/lipase
VRRVRSPFVRLVYWLALAASSALLFVAVWILVPAPDERLLPLGVVAPEITPILLVVSLLLMTLAAAYARILGTARLALVLSAVSTVLCLWPLVSVPPTLRRFDETMQRVLGIEARGNPIRYSDLFRPPRAVGSRIVRGVPFEERDGTPLSLDIYEPSTGSGPVPILVQLYGGAWQRGGPSDNGWFARYFASRGYVVVAADYRHAPQFQWPAQVDDVRSALRWIGVHSAEFKGDSHRIVVVGRSSGAQLALVAAYQEPSPSIRGVISLYGPVDLAEGWRHPPEPDPLHVRRILEAYLGGTPAEVPQRYRAASPITYATRKLPPTLLIYGGRDHVVEARFGEQLDRALQRAGTRSVLLELPWSEHAFDIIPNGLGGQIALHYTERFISWAVK